MAQHCQTLLFKNLQWPSVLQGQSPTLHPGIPGAPWSGSNLLLKLWPQDSGCRVAVLFPEIPHSFSFLPFSCSCPHRQCQQCSSYSHFTHVRYSTSKSGVKSLLDYRRPKTLQHLWIFSPLRPALRKMSDLMARTELQLCSGKVSWYIDDRGPAAWDSSLI